jgi:hypothetical protein
MAIEVHTTTRGYRSLLGLAMLWGIIGFAIAETWAEGDTGQSRRTLRGLQGVNVLIESVQFELGQAGLSVQQLQADVELRLRHAGIPILTLAERGRVPGQPVLYITVKIELGFDGLTAFSIDVELNQMASLEIDTAPAVVATWSVGSVGTVDTARLYSIRDRVRDKGDDFINAYFSIHPRPTDRSAR